MNNADLHTKNQTAWIVFSGQTDMPILRLFKKGFRHCFVVLKDQGRWIVIDPMASMLCVDIADVPSGFDVPTWLEGQGHRVISATITPQDTPACLGFFTCVSVVKRVIGLRRMRIFTPYQLYKYLTKHQQT